MKKEFNIVATLYRANRPVWCRRYLKLDNAIKRAAELAVQTGAPKDVVEFHHNVTGMQIGTLKVGVNSLTARWVW